MKPENKFTEVMKERTYKELLDIVGKLREEYQPEAVVAAELELANRKPPIEINEPEEIKFKKKKHNAIDKANEPLDHFEKVYSFAFPYFYRFITADRLVSEGYLRQAKEMRQWTLVGMLTYFIIFVLFIVIAILI